MEVTRSGVQIWRTAMNLRGTAEDETATAMTRSELVTLNALLKKMTLHVEGRAGHATTRD